LSFIIVIYIIIYNLGRNNSIRGKVLGKSGFSLRAAMDFSPHALGEGILVFHRHFEELLKNKFSTGIFSTFHRACVKIFAATMPSPGGKVPPKGAEEECGW
jgi:hypothetical protein